jgi:FkbM family methyltransferase
MLGFAGDRYITPELAHGDFMPGEWAMLAQLAKPGMTVIEAGANVGGHTVRLARACRPGPLYAFEPQHRVFQVLCANLALNGIGNVLAYPEGCGETEGVATIPPVDYEANRNFGGVSLGSADAPGVKVRVVAIDSLELASCGLIKIDVEGFEPQVLRGARETIARCRPVLYVENDRPPQQAEVIDLVAGMNYRLYWHTPRLTGIEEKNIVSVNMLCMPKERRTKVEGLQEIDPANWTCPVRL